MTEQFVAAIVGAPFGLKGFVKVKPLSGEIGHLLKLKTATLRQGGKERPLAIEEIAPIPPAVAIRFAGYDTPEAAKALRGAELIVGRENAAPLQSGEFYVEDLKGLVVYAAESPEEFYHGRDNHGVHGVTRKDDDDRTKNSKLSAGQQDSVVNSSSSENEGGRVIGHIVNIIEGGGGDLAEIRLQNGEVKLVPFRKEFFPVVDLAQKQATLQNLWVLE